MCTCRLTLHMPFTDEGCATFDSADTQNEEHTRKGKTIHSHRRCARKAWLWVEKRERSVHRDSKK